MGIVCCGGINNIEIEMNRRIVNPQFPQKKKFISFTNLVILVQSFYRRHRAILKLKKEINYLKENFWIKKTDEKKICENLLLYKNRITISKALRSVENLCERLNVNNLNNANIEKLANDIEEIKVYSEISNCARELKKIDEKFLEKNFLEILLNFNQNDKLISFLETQKESETRDLIDGLFDDENEENFTIELKDIEILINVVCFFQDIKSKTNNLSAFLNNFHSILDKKRNLYK